MAGSIEALSAYRYERACDDLNSSKILFRAEQYSQSLNRSYYAVFHGMRAVNALDGFDSGKHSGVISHFNHYHVKNGDFSAAASRIVSSASEQREHADYLDFYIASKQDAEKQIENAELFLGCVKDFLVSKGIALSASC